MGWEDMKHAKEYQRVYGDDVTFYVDSPTAGLRHTIRGVNAARAVAGNTGGSITLAPPDKQGQGWAPVLAGTPLDNKSRWAPLSAVPKPPPTGGSMLDTEPLTRLAPAAQWRVLTALYFRERQTRPHMDARGLLRQQDASSDYLVDLSRRGLVEGAVPGRVVDLATINWAVALRRTHYVSVRITKAGCDGVRQPLSMLLNATGRGRRYSIRDVCHTAGIGNSARDSVLREAEGLGLVVASGDDGQRVELATFQRSAIPLTLRLSLTRRGGTYLPRKG